MEIRDLFQETYQAIVVNKVRSGLTTLGIIIGIASVIALVAIGNGAQQSIQNSIQSLGSNLIIVVPGAVRGGGISEGRGSAQSLTIADSDAISQALGSAVTVAPEVSRRYQVVAAGQNTNTSVIGVTADYAPVRNFQIDEGSFISEQNVRAGAKVAVLGPTTRDDIFGQGANAVGQKIKVRNVDFTVIGVTMAKGGSGFSNPDDVVLIPLATAQRYLSGNTYVSDISIQVADPSAMVDIQQQVTDLLMNRHNIRDASLADFSIVNQADIISTASSITGIFTILLASIAGISLLVGGIGIMNMMLTTVTERTREIGLRKAVGAKKKDITLQFLMESIMLTFFGGLIGILLGWLLSLIAGRFVGVNATVSVGSIILAFSVSAGIGILFGYYPARRAAGLNPIEALRYE